MSPEPKQREIERLPIPEKKAEIERLPAPVEEKRPIPPLSLPLEIPLPAPKSVPAPLRKSPRLQKIEQILSEGLVEIYQKMPSEQQRIFKEKGEETASKIEELITAAKFQVRKIFDLIKNWLKLIPAVNKFFLEQEAKIKTDKVVIMTEEERDKGL